jgi:hypothetical protein
VVMEWIMDHLESWKDLYCEELDELTNIPTPSSSRTRSGRHARSQPTSNTSALPPHARQVYLKRRKRISNTAIETLQDSNRVHMRTSMNNDWEKLNEYYTLVGKSPLDAASIILNPKLGLRFLEKSWSSVNNSFGYAMLRLLWISTSNGGSRQAHSLYSRPFPQHQNRLYPLRLVRMGMMALNNG